MKDTQFYKNLAIIIIVIAIFLLGFLCGKTTTLNNLQVKNIINNGKNGQIILSLYNENYSYYYEMEE